MSVEVQFDLQGVDEFVAAVQRFDAATQERIRAWLYDWAQRVCAQAERNAPVRTGYLKSTIYAAVQEWVAQIGVGASYGYFVEFGTRFMRAQPFLYPAIQEFLPELEMNIIGALEQAKAEAAL
jgi:HK97 gp10 family phage protein